MSERHPHWSAAQQPRGNRPVPPRPAAAPEPDNEPENEAQEEPTPDLSEELAAITRERDEYLDALQRLKAEFDNYRKRTVREQEVARERAAERLVKDLLPLLDDLERAVEHAVEHGEVKLADGVRLVHRALASMLVREGLQEVETEGAFDPHTQEALLSQPSEKPEGAVIQVVQKGYRLGDRVLRPARVVVSAGPPAQPPRPEE